MRTQAVWSQSGASGNRAGGEVTSPAQGTDLVAPVQNAFWFCLAWCTFFLIPSIIFAVKTSKYFRPIRKRLR